MQRHYSSQPKHKDRYHAIAINTLDFLQSLSFPLLGETAKQHQPRGLNTSSNLLSCQSLTFFSSLIDQCRKDRSMLPPKWLFLPTWLVYLFVDRKSTRLNSSHRCIS